MTPAEAVEKLTDFVRGYRVPDLAWVIPALPATVDPALVVTLFGRCADKPGFLAIACAKLPPRAIRAVLASLPALPPRPDLVMWQVAVPPDLDDGALSAAWKRALAATGELSTSYGWGTRQRRQKIRALATDAAMLPAIQAAVAASTANVSLDMLAVLAADGSATSYDALIAHIGAAFAEPGRRLDLLSKLRTHAARTPLFDALFAEIDGALDVRNDTSPALAIGEAIGIGKPALLWFSLRLRAAGAFGNGMIPYGIVEVDSRASVWFKVFATSGARHTRFSSDPSAPARDELGVGTCAVAELPQWIAGVARELAIAWQPHAPTTHLRGAKKALLIRWLEGQPA